MRSTPITLLSGTLAWTLLFAATCVSPPALAGVFSVTPVRIYISVRDRAVAVTVTNDGDEQVVLQADIYTWEQSLDGTDKLELTDNLVLSPPILKLAPKARQVVRLARLTPPDVSRQQTYRLILREIPEAGPPRPNIQIAISLALSMPVFITPPGAKRVVNCSIAGIEGKTVGVRCSNTGTAYSQVREIEIVRDKKKLAAFSGGAYILPGASKTMAAGIETAVSPGPVKVVVTFDDSKTQEFELSLP